MSNHTDTCWKPQLDRGETITVPSTDVGLHCKHVVPTHHHHSSSSVTSHPTSLFLLEPFKSRPSVFYLFCSSVDRKVFSKLHFHLPEDTVNRIALSTVGVIEPVLSALREKIDKKLEQTADNILVCTVCLCTFPQRHTYYELRLVCLSEC